ncbi:MAG: SPASM domain-containing protein [Chitinophagales bacterium]|nr:SPASM domain-containing protein [Chitinophagales bacterium]
MAFLDALHFLSNLSVSKVCNAVLVYTSFYLAKWLQKPIAWGMPFTISVEPTTSCNLGCPECPSGLKSFTRPTGNLELSLYKKLVDETHRHLLYMYFYFQGEPYLHPQFLEMVKYASDKKIYTVTSTNAHFLTERKARETVQSGLSRILISIDGTTQDTYEQYRIGGTLEKVIEGTKNLIAAKRELKSSTPHIVFQFLVVKPNEHQTEEVKKLAAELGVDEVKFKTAQIYDYKNGHELIPTVAEYSRYKKAADGTYQIKNELKNQCWKMWHSNVVTWDGKVVPCCFDKDAQHQMGHISTNSISEIWHNEAYIQFRKKLISGRKEIDICTNCSEGTKVWAD